MVMIAFLAAIMFLFLKRVNEFKGEAPFDTYLETISKKGNLFKDVFLENQTMVNYLYISRQGLFNIYYDAELLGRIYGDDEESTWKQVLEHRKLPVPNPVRLLEKQHREFEKIATDLEIEFPIYECICLSKRAVAKLTISTPIVLLDELVGFVKEKEDVLTDEEVKTLIALIEKIKE